MAAAKPLEAIHELAANSELRFEVLSTGTATIELIRGKGEIFGTELVPSKKYTFQASSKVALFTYHGCTVKLSGDTEVAYVATQTPMNTYVNVHAALEQLRTQTMQQDYPRGPRVMIAGPTDVGKSTLCRMLINYAVRAERFPVYVDLDVGQGEISVPGMIGALLVQRPHDIEEGYPQSQSLIYHFGHKAPSDNVLLYNQLVSTLAQSVNIRCEQNKNTAASGVIINTSGWIKNGGFKSLVHIAGAFEVDVIIVIDQERLYVELEREMPPFVKVVLLPKSGGVVERSRSHRINSREMRIKSYFYGVKNNMSPHCFYVNFQDIKIYKIGAPELSDSLLPLGMIMKQSQTKIMPLVPSPSMKHRLLSVCSCEPGSEEEIIISSPVLGFVVVTEVDMERCRLMVLAPAPAPLPRNILLDTEITFVDAK